MSPRTDARRTLRRLASLPLVVLFTGATLALTGVGPAHGETSTAELGSAEGVVADPDGIPIEGVLVRLWRHMTDPTGAESLEYVARVNTDETGVYQFGALAPGRYTSVFTCSTPCVGYLSEWWNDQVLEQDADFFEVPPGQATTGLDVVLTTGVSISGRVTGVGGKPLENVLVKATPYAQTLDPEHAATGADGTYQIRGLRTASYSIRFAAASGSGYVDETWDDDYSQYGSTPVNLSDGHHVSGMDARLSLGGSISGVVYDDDGDPVDATVGLMRKGGTIGAYMVSQGQYGYEFEMVPPGQYTIVAGPVDDHLGEWWSDKPDVTTADFFELTEGGSVTEIDPVVSTKQVELSLAAIPFPHRVGETMTANVSSPTPGARFAFQWFVDRTAIPGATAATLVPQVSHLGGHITVRVIATAPRHAPALAETDWTHAVEMAPPPAHAAVSRIAGLDRFATSAAISRSQFSPGVDSVFIASGLNYPDALSGAPVAALRGGPLLLTTSTELPQVIIDELERLKPKRAIIFGGAASVSSRVEDQVRALTELRTADRFAGPDRYATSVAISQMEFHPPGTVAYLASGENFPDALSGAPLGATTRGPVLLTASGALPAIVEQELQRLKPERIVILGGPGSVGPAVEARLDELVPGSPTRLAGLDRYSTSAEISAFSFQPGVQVAYIASGYGFPDALSGAPLAGIQGGPVLLTAPDVLPAVVERELLRLNPRRIVVLGGSATIGDGVRDRLASLDMSH